MSTITSQVIPDTTAFASLLSVCDRIFSFNVWMVPDVLTGRTPAGMPWIRDIAERAVSRYCSVPRLHLIITWEPSTFMTDGQTCAAILSPYRLMTSCSSSTSSSTSLGRQTIWLYSARRSRLAAAARPVRAPRCAPAGSPRRRTAHAPSHWRE